MVEELVANLNINEKVKLLKSILEERIKEQDKDVTLIDARELTGLAYPTIIEYVTSWGYTIIKKQIMRPRMLKVITIEKGGEEECQSILD